MRSRRSTRLDADVITFECASTGGMDLELIGAAISSDKKVAIGVVDHRNLHVESPEQVAALIRRALEHSSPSGSRSRATAASVARG